jgi:endonuclease/exonuclease/phosphatase family metal-dependent hydrolase
MKRTFLPLIFLIILFSFLPIRIFSDTISLATFNIRIFSNNSRNDKELHQICNILKEFDFVAIQEVRDTKILDRTVSMLKNQFSVEYNYIASSKVGTEKVKEIYAYLYRTDKVKLLEDLGVYPDPKNVFIREPFIAFFKAGNFDFYVISIHSIYGDCVCERRYEANKLSEVYSKIQNRDDENDVMLLGDFNLSPDDKGFVELLNIPNMVYVNGKILTSIKNRLYDNIFFQSYHTKEYTGKFGVIKFDESLNGCRDILPLT